jgi:uncharacterized protein (UPF0305 family)
MYLNELLESLKNESLVFEESSLIEKLNTINSKSLTDLKASKMELLSKHNLETMLELKHKSPSTEDILIDDEKATNLKSTIDAFMDKHAPGDQEQKIYIRTICVYLTFIAKKPLHPAGFFDPDGKIVYKNGQVVCPIKSQEIDKAESLCRFCVASL